VNLSVIIITRNEAARIGACLASVSWADEIVVLDSGSTDDTVAICRAAGATVHETDWPGFGPQKNRALDLATGDWVLSVDADEAVTPELREEIVAAISTPRTAIAWRMPRLSTFLGRPMRHSGWWPDYVVRVFKRGTARFTDSAVHERLVPTGEVGTFRHPLLHESVVSLEDSVGKMNQYSSASARMLHQQGRRASLGAAIARGIWTFLHGYVLRAGFLDGREGLMLAIANAEGSYYRHAKLALLSRK
jgi:glycosyltransferase involved in cell wall biosynthesis